MCTVRYCTSVADFGNLNSIQLFAYIPSPETPKMIFVNMFSLRIAFAGHKCHIVERLLYVSLIQFKGVGEGGSGGMPPTYKSGGGGGGGAAQVGFNPALLDRLSVLIFQFFHIL